MEKGKTIQVSVLRAAIDAVCQASEAIPHVLECSKYVFERLSGLTKADWTQYALAQQWV